MKKETKDLPKWLWIFAILLIIILIVGSGFIGIIPAIIALFSASKCSKWAKRIQSNITLAFLIGLFFGLFGLLFYYIYYRTKRKKK